MRRDPIGQTDEELLASLGYKQEFTRAFSPLEVRFEALIQTLGVILLP